MNKNDFTNELKELMSSMSEEEIEKTINKQAEINKIRKDLPILILSGSDDPVGEKGKGVFKVAEQLKAAKMTDVAVSLFEGMRHEILNEKNKQHVYDVVLRWLKEYE